MDKPLEQVKHACWYCRYAEGRWDNTRAIDPVRLYCAKHKMWADQSCADFEREPGAEG